MPPSIPRARVCWHAAAAVVLLTTIGEATGLAQAPLPFQRTQEEENRFRERQYRSHQAEVSLNACIQKEVERDLGMKYVSVPTAVTSALDTCFALLERYASIDCLTIKFEGKEIGENSCAKVERERQMTIWMPILLKRRVELQFDGPKYLYDFASHFVYAVVARNEKANTTVQGTGVALDKRHLAANCHVIEQATTITAYQGQKKFSVRRAGFSPGKHGPDRCLLFVDETLLAFAAIREWRDLSVGERIFVIGMPQGFALDEAPTLSDGVLSGKRTDGKHRLILTNAPIPQSSAGGGLFDSSGRLVGVTTFTLTTMQNMNFAIAAEDWQYELCQFDRFFFGPAPDCTRHKPVP